ncbi:S10 family peptidase [Neorhizobium sp. NPDC001467]|uniref:S10 family peptidase n=1 Tax=Neorhizobium sp. NPDC001467 TaxID=3390595 RepID=UPI003D070204
MPITPVPGLAACAFAALLALASPAWSQMQSPEPDTKTGGQEERSSAGIFGLIPADKTTDHALKLEGGDLPYTATAGTLDMLGQDGTRTAKIYYTAYVAKDRKPGRPLTFAFNGGPGAASAYLHMGLVGPKVLEFGVTGDNGTTPMLKDNPDSWLAFTDLVLIDPVGTGWSRAASDEAAGNFYKVRQDAESLAKAIALYVQRNDRLEAPKYLLGESYGGFRAAKVAAALKDSQSMLVSGIVMLSPLLEGRFLGNASDPLTAALQLPSLAAAEMERRGTFTPAGMNEAERFAMGPYLTSLAGPAPDDKAGDGLYSRLAGMTGLPKDAIARSRGFLGDIYAKHMAGRGRVVSPYDAAYAVPDAYPEAPYGQNDDPILDGYTRAYGSAFAAYARNTLGFSTEMTYTLLNTEVNRRWEWNGNRGGDARALASVSDDLRDLFSVIPTFRLMIAHGYSDALTPYGVSRYVIDHMPPDLVGDRASLKVYRGGHMFYTQLPSRQAMAADARAFYTPQASE